jgi:hypothetical protein
MFYLLHALEEKLDGFRLDLRTPTEINNQAWPVGRPTRSLISSRNKPRCSLLSRRQMFYDDRSLAVHARFSGVVEGLRADNAIDSKSTVTRRSRCSSRVPSTTALRTNSPEQDGCSAKCSRILELCRDRFRSFLRPKNSP